MNDVSNSHAAFALDAAFVLDVVGAFFFVLGDSGESESESDESLESDELELNSRVKSVFEREMTCDSTHSEVSTTSLAL